MNWQIGDRLTVLGELADSVWGERISKECLEAFWRSALERPGRVAVPRRSACHILSGNTPQAGLQSLWRALLAGVEEHYIKWPSGGLPEVAAWLRRLPSNVGNRIRSGVDLSEQEWARHDVVAAYGSDMTISLLRQRLLPAQRMLEFGHRWSIGIVESEWEEGLLDGVIEDIVLFDQLGCLSLQSVFVARDGLAFAEALARRIDEGDVGKGVEVPMESAARIFRERHSAKLRGALGEPVRVWESEASCAWTVVWDGSEEKRPLPQHRFVEVRALPEDLAVWLGEEAKHLAAVALDHSHVERWLALRPSRFCAFGQMQRPRFDWYQENRPPLDGWVDWVDLEVAAPGQDA